MAVETSGCGFDVGRRPKMLFERHVFHRLTAGRFDAVAPDLSHPVAGGYEAARGASHQYERLERAMALDDKAALQSSSWGLGQVLGMNARGLGLASARAMAAAFAEGEDRQLAAMVAFIRGAKIDGALRRHDWSAFAAVYNGKAFRALGYDARLATCHERYLRGPVPDLYIRALQIALIWAGFGAVGAVDGVDGPRTQRSLMDFQRSAGLRANGRADEATVTALLRSAGWAR
jgi:hypothetical protein